MPHHPVTQQIQNLLKQHGYWFKTFEHEPVITSQEAAKIRHGYTMKQGAKAMIVRVKKSKKDKKFIMLVLPDHLKFDTNKVKSLFQAKDVRLATKEEITTVTKGVLPGGVPPFGNLFGLGVVVDPKLLDNEKIIFNAGDRCFSMAIKSQDYVTLVSPKISNITPDTKCNLAR